MSEAAKTSIGRWGGRPAKYVRHPDTGQEIFGLSMRQPRPGRRYGRLYATRERSRTFGTPRDDDELRTAIARFRAAYPGDDPPAVVRVEMSLLDFARRKTTGLEEASAQEVVASGRFQMGAGDGGLVELSSEWLRNRALRVTEELTEPEYWLEVGRQVRRRPGLWARRLGVQEIAWLAELDPPAPSVSLERIGRLYEVEKAGHITPKEVSRCKTWWGEFCKLARPAKTVRDVSKAGLRRYAEKIHGDQREKGCADSYTRGRFLCVRTVFNYAFDDPELDIPAAEIVRLKKLFKRVLKPPGQPKGNAEQIEVKDFRKLLEVASTPFDRCILLLGLNGAYYSKDLTELRFDQHVDFKGGGISFRRAKTGVVQVCKLWPRTATVLKEVLNDDDGRTHVFMFGGKPVHPYTVAQHFSRLCEQVGVEGVTLGHLRDSAVTIAARCASSAQYQALMGHRVGRGADDNYIARNFEFVADACGAVHRHYFGSEPW